ncbi:MAG: chromosome segregation SMC family protein, partial [Candidatus Micrarchaeaceae archaeon]
MLYLKSLTIDKFKSFKHAEILISKGFTCIVGPNGSGKSNICDALLFGLGEGSTNRLRATKLEELINFGVKRKRSEVAKAYVKLEFSGDQDYVIVRTVRSDGKTQYTLNGKQVVRQEVLEVLASNGMRAAETNTITQGEINRIISMNPRERRELIDIASGIKEFEAKKADALRELEKVSQRISETQGALNEKVSFLRELEKEKEAAEKFSEYSAKLKSLRYSILVARKEILKRALDNYTKDLAILDSEKNAAELKRSEIAKKLSDFDTEREALTHEITSSNTTMAEINSRRDSINRELASLEAELSGHRSLLMEIGSFTEESDKELARINDTLQSGTKSIEEMQERLSELEKEAGAAVATESIGNKEKEIEELSKVVQKLEKKVSDSKAIIIKYEAEGDSLAESIKGLEKALEDGKAALKEKEKSLESLKELNKSLGESARKAAESAKKSEAERQRLKKEIEELDEKIIALKEQKSYISSKGNSISERIGRQFSEPDGFYGQASSLCSYDPQNAIAIETAAGARFDFFVTDSISTADRIIEYLKKNELGRATFIPIKELRVESAVHEEKGLKPVLDLVKYDKKFDKIFRYIFSNTYIISKAEDAERYGIGVHRYVTPDGELIEHSGTISGGYSKRKVSLSAIENQLKDATALKARLAESMAKAEENAFNERKAAAAAEMKLDSNSKELARLESELASERKALSGITSRISESKERLSLLKESSSAESVSASSAEKELAAAQARLMRIYNEAVEATKDLAAHGMSKPARERLEKARADAEGIRIKIAEIRKEAQMLESRKQELLKQSEEKQKLAKST